MIMSNPIRKLPHIILASNSPRRRQLLEWAEVDFSVITRNTIEFVNESLPLEEIPVEIARTKAMAVKTDVIDLSNNEGYSSQLAHTPILAADTIVVLEGKIIGKPEDSKDAVQILKKLNGQTHQVITGVVILCGDMEIKFSDTTEVTFHTLSDADLEGYVNKYQPFDKAGAYAIQEWIGVVGIKKINGDFYNVMGLPVSRVMQKLQQLCADLDE